MFATKYDAFFNWTTRVLLVAILAYSVWFLGLGNHKAAKYIFAGALVLAVVMMIGVRMPEIVPMWLQAMIAVFVVLAGCMGFGYNVYSMWWPWDDWMHGISGVIFGLFGVVLIESVVDRWSPKLPIWIRVIAATMFAAYIALLWELYEFGSDLLVGTFLQQNDLHDTMTDLLFGTFWGLVTASGYYIMQKLRIRRKNS